MPLHSPITPAARPGPRLRAQVAVAAIVSCTLLGIFVGVVGCAPRDTAVADPEAMAAVWELAGKAPHVRSSAGVVVSGHPLASEVGADVLASGGNAVDAAVAVGFALAAVLPQAGNIGGGGFLVYRAADGEVRSLDYREKAPAAAHRDMYLDENGELTDRSVIGHLAAGVPGSVAGLVEMHSVLGSKPWAELVDPAIALAEGHEIDEPRHDALQSAAETLSRFDASASQFLVDGLPPAVGAMWSQPDLARTLERIRNEGSAGFYEGETADLIVAEMERGGGIMTKDDLLAYEAVWREPIVAEYRGYTTYSMPPPSSGGVTLALLLNMVESQPLAAADTVAGAHLRAEVMRRAFIERNRSLGDPDFVDMPIDQLQSQDYADELRGTVDLTKATPTAPDAIAPTEGTQTTHYSIVDGQGNAVSVTTTINSSFGSRVTVAGAGFLLNNEMDDFAAAPGKPNQFGLVEGENNAVASNKRMLSSMTPTIVEDAEGRLHMVVGSPGGPTIITSVFQVITNVLDQGMDLVAAVESPRMHHQALPDQIFVEPGGFSGALVAELESLGHTVEVRGGFSGDIAAILRESGPDGDDASPVWLGVADPRRGAGVAAPESR